MGVLGEAFVEIRPTLDKFAGELKTGVEKATAGVEQQTSGFDKLATVGGKAFKALSAGAIGFAALAVKTAIDAEQTQAQLRTAIENTGGAWDQQEPKIAKAADSLERFGFTNDEVGASILKLTQQTGDSDKAMANIGLAADIARARHIDLADASTIVGKVLNGNVGILKRYGLASTDAAGNTLTAEAAIKQLQERMGGAAAANADTFGGKMAVLKAQLHNTTEEIGTKLLPVVIEVAERFGTVVKFFTDGSAASKVLAAVIAGPLVIAMTAYAVKQAQAFGATVIRGWSEVAGVVSDVGDALGITTSAIAEQVVATENAVAINLAAADSTSVFADSISAAVDEEALFTDNLAAAGGLLPGYAEQMQTAADAAGVSAEALAAQNSHLANMDVALSQTSGLLGGLEVSQEGAALSAEALAAAELEAAAATKAAGASTGIGWGKALGGVTVAVTALVAMNAVMDKINDTAGKMQARFDSLKFAKGAELLSTFKLIGKAEEDIGLNDKGFRFIAENIGLTDEKAQGLVGTFHKVERNVIPFYEAWGKLTGKQTSEQERLDAAFKKLAEQDPAAAKRLIASFAEQGESAKHYEGILGDVGKQHVQTAADAKLNAEIEDELTGETDEATAAVLENRDAQRELANRLHISNPATLDLRDAMTKLVAPLSTAVDKADALKSRLDALIGINITAEAAVIQFTSGLTDLGDTLDGGAEGALALSDAQAALADATAARTAVFADAKSTSSERAAADRAVRDATLGVKDALDRVNPSMDINTKRGQENRTAIQGSVEAALAHHDALIRQGIALPIADAALEQDRLKLIDVMVQHGLTREAAEAYINALGLTPAVINTRLALDTAAAELRLAAFERQAAKVANTQILVTFSAGGGVRVAQGGGFTGNQGGLWQLHPNEIILPLDHPAAAKKWLAEAIARQPALVGVSANVSAPNVVVPKGAVQTHETREGGDTFHVVVNNPVAEPASTSVPRELRRFQYLRRR